VSPRRTLVRLLRLVAVGLVTLLVVPGSAVRPATISLYGVETAKGVDFSDGSVWVLVLGSDSEGLTDAIQLVGIDAATGSAVGLGIPRDTYLDVPGIGEVRINQVYSDDDGGPLAVARVVEGLTGISPDLVLHLDSQGFLALLDTVGPVDVRTPEDFVNDGVQVDKGLNTFSPDEALAYADFRVGLDLGDFDRSANHQRLMLAALTALRAHKEEVGFMEQATLTALDNLDTLDTIDTDLGLRDLYRLAQLVTTVEPQRVDTCVITGSFEEIQPSGASVVIVEEAFAQQIGVDAQDFRLEKGCPGFDY
jgi:LCP family protein required for cell wall assembly